MIRWAQRHAFGDIQTGVRQDTLTTRIIRNLLCDQEICEHPSRDLQLRASLNQALPPQEVILEHFCVSALSQYDHRRDEESRLTGVSPVLGVVPVVKSPADLVSHLPQDGAAGSRHGHVVDARLCKNMRHVLSYLSEEFHGRQLPERRCSGTIALRDSSLLRALHGTLELVEATLEGGILVLMARLRESRSVASSMAASSTFLWTPVCSAAWSSTCCGQSSKPKGLVRVRNECWLLCNFKVDYRRREVVC